jgi:hypothetical protein
MTVAGQREALIPEVQGIGTWKAAPHAGPERQQVVGRQRAIVLAEHAAERYFTFKPSSSTAGRSTASRS